MRFKSFRRAHPEIIRKDAESFADCRFFYVTRDIVACFQCGVILTNFQYPLEVDLWTVHFLKQPSCKYVHLVTKGKVFNRQRTPLYERIQIYTPPSRVLLNQYIRRQVINMLETESSNSEGEVNHNNIVERIILPTKQNATMERIPSNVRNQIFSQILNIFYMKKTSTKNIATQTDENENDEMLCLICCERKKDVIFIPCHHLVTCTRCCFADDKCPLCRCEYEWLKYCYV